MSDNVLKKVSRFSWLEYIGVLLALGGLAMLPALMFGADILTESGPYIGWYVLYWGIIAALFCLLTGYQKYIAFDKPMRELSLATKQVAEGDFTVYLKPLHTVNKHNYIDTMFQDFNKMVEALGSLETMKTNFIADVSHEIKTPLSIVQNYAAALKNENMAPETRMEYVETIISASQSLSVLVSNILSLNKLENQGIQLPEEPYDVCRQLSDCILSFDDLLAQKEIQVEVDIEEQASIYADSDLMEIVWRNLLANALKFTEPGGVIKCTQTSTENSVSIAISDTGCGMDEETRKRVFEKFYQGDSSRSKEGNGLGLALSLRVVELVGGTITVESELGEGTTFVVTLNAGY
ncbi:HAMP domain-containing histidine kinase [Listeria booriae]|uniref:HAMP domain-containing sensor histidine kinase n=1 Tax=Listeria booriae TaxID=1552123 RepID=UPI001624B45C|nr:HAMP domain-containing sensor histidine kinase [Listeria booriae]MBC2263613.1 HAMP domain-containing histidine kinase [Listeria booriae]